MLPLSLWWPLGLDEGVDPPVIVAEEQRPDAPDPAATAAAVTSIAIDPRQPASAGVADLVGQVAGTTVHELGGLGDFSAVSIRGSSLRQVAVYLDGVPLNPDGSDAINLAELPASAFSRVDVYRSGAPPVYAAAPIGGVVDLITSPRAVAPTFALAGGSFGTATLSALANPQSPGRSALFAADLFTTAGDWQALDDNGTAYNLADDHRPLRENNEKAQASGLLRAKVDRGPLRLTLLDSGLRRQEGLPGPVHSPAQVAHLSTDRNLAVLEGSRSTAQSRLLLRAWDLRRVEDWSDPLGELGVGAEERRSTTATDGLLASGLFVAGPHALPGLTLALRQDRHRAEDLDRGQIARGRHRETLTAALHADLFTDTLRLSPVLMGMVARSHRLSSEPFQPDAAVQTDPTLHSLDPRIGLLYRPLPALALKANAGRFLRPPDLTELFGDRGTIQGNALLRPERGQSADLGLRLQSPQRPAAVDLTAFGTDTQDAIVYLQNAQRVLTPTNLGRATVYGLELNLSAAPAPWLDLQGSATQAWSENRSPSPAVNGKQLPRVPQTELYEAIGLHRGEAIRLGWSWSYTSGNYWDATNWYAAAPRSLHGAFLRLSRGHLSGELDLRNLFNHTVEATPRDPLDPDSPLAVRPLTDFAGYPLPGRTLLLSLRWRGDTPEA